MQATLQRMLWASQPGQNGRPDSIAESYGFANFTSVFQAEGQTLLEGSRWLSIIGAASVLQSFSHLSRHLPDWYGNVETHCTIWRAFLWVRDHCYMVADERTDELATPDWTLDNSSVDTEDCQRCDSRVAAYDKIASALRSKPISHFYSRSCICIFMFCS